MIIYAGNISYTLNEEDIRNIFEIEGQVESVKLVRDRNTGKSKGYCFVEMPNKAEAVQAIKMLHKREIRGRTLIVMQARERTVAY